MSIRGVKHKSAAYLRLLMGLPSIAIDVRRLAASVGVEGTDAELEEHYTAAADAEGRSLQELDGGLWHAGADASSRSST